jgi:hypothetical protein
VRQKGCCDKDFALNRLYNFLLEVPAEIKIENTHRLTDNVFGRRKRRDIFSIKRSLEMKKDVPLIINMFIVYALV